MTGCQGQALWTGTIVVVYGQKRCPRFEPVCQQKNIQICKGEFVRGARVYYGHVPRGILGCGTTLYYYCS